MSRDLVARGAALAVAAALSGFAVGMLASDQPGWLWFLEALLLGAICLLVGGAVFRRPAIIFAGVARAADRFASGELDVRAPAATGPGADLTYSFNTMAHRVQELLDVVAREHARLEAVFAAATDAMVAVSEDMTVRFLNPAAARLFDTTAAAALDRPFIETARDYELDAVLRRVIGGNGEPRTEVITFGPQRIPLRAAAVSITDGGTWAALLVLADLTEVARVDQLRRDFLSNVSHELRTPLASIRALVETMQEGVDPEETQEFLKRIGLQVERMTALVNEFLDLSRIESGATELEPESLDLVEIAHEAAALLRPKAEKEGVKIAGPDASGIVAELDHAAILRVINNLLDNAIKFSPEGSTITMEAVDEGDAVALSVHNEGPPIPAHELPRVFERFYKGDLARANSGSGLGLAIVKHTVRVHGGTATVENGEPDGVTFTIRLPKKYVGGWQRGWLLDEAVSP